MYNYIDIIIYELIISIIDLYFNNYIIIIYNKNFALAKSLLQKEVLNLNFEWIVMAFYSFQEQKQMASS